MNEAERNGLSAMRDVWISGGPAAGMAPVEWREMVAAAPADQQERLLLAIAGQALDVAFRPAAPKSLTARAALPQLDLPSLPDRHRPLFRSALRNANDNRSKLRVAGLAAARGYVAHPLDWMPSASELDAPRVYAPWVDWQDATRAGGPQFEDLTADNWDEFYPAARRLALADIRRSDPARARALLEAKAAAEPAEKRLPLIELMRVNLSGEDAQYLESLASDRSGKIKQLAARLLARIGKVQSGADANEQIRELADFIDKGTSGLLRRRATYTAKTLKNWAQTNRRNELFEACQLVDVAAQFQVSDLDFIEGWQLGGKDHVDYAFTGMVAESGSDEAVAKLASRLLGAGDAASYLLLLPRLDAAASRMFVKMVLTRGAQNLHLLSAMPDFEAGTFSAADLSSSTAYKEMRAQVANKKPGDGGATPDFGLFGYLATAQAAETLVADLTTAGLGSADPSLALLRLNAALST